MIEQLASSVSTSTPGVFTYVNSTIVSNSGAPLTSACTNPSFPYVFSDIKHTNKVSYINAIDTDDTTELISYCGVSTLWIYKTSRPSGKAFIGIMNNLGRVVWAVHLI